MKKFMLLMALLTTMVVEAAAMTYSQARQEALFLTDKMAYELQLSREQCEAVYEINIDYLMAVDSRASLYGWAWERRNSDLRYVLTAYQYDLYMQANYFYRPISWRSSSWRMRIYRRYGEHTVYYSAPLAYKSYRGGNNSHQRSYYADRNFNKPTTIKLPPNNGTSNHGRNSATSSSTTSWRSGSSGYNTSTSGSGSSWRASSAGNTSSTRSSSSTNKQQSNNTQNKTASGGQFKGKR